jgi:phosphoglycerate dehydrogenase-like enzyme
MADDKPLVWLPFEADLLTDPPAGLRYEVVVPEDGVETPGSVAEVEFYVPPYRFNAADGDPIASMPRLRVVQSLTAGVDHLRPQVPEGVSLCSGRGIHDASTAELAVALILASLRGLPDFVRAQDRGEWAPTKTTSLADRKVAIVGYGAIGQAIERRLEGFEADVVRVARTARQSVHGFDDLPGLLPELDVVVLIMPLTDDTRGLVDEAFLSRMREGALLVNMARGPVVRNDALIAALEAGRIRAAVDVTDPEPLPPGHPLWSAPNLLLSPHVGGASTAMWPRAYKLVRDQLERFAAGAEMRNVIRGDY